MKLTKTDKQFITELRSAIINEEYDDFCDTWGDEWEIIEQLLGILENLEE